ncbi:MAG: hypothetical protein ACP5OG_00595 [Candidatus Nanoarchaeia archaeon]
MTKEKIKKLYFDWMLDEGRNLAAHEENRHDFLKHILKPVREEMYSQELKKQNQDTFGRMVSAKEAYDLFKELAEIQEKRGNLFDASESWNYAGRIADSAKAPEIAKKLFLRSAENLEKLYGPTANANYRNDKMRMFKKSGNLKRAAEVAEKDEERYIAKYKEIPWGDSIPKSSWVYEEAGEYDKALKTKVSKEYSPFRLLKKAGRYEELAKVYEQISKDYKEKGNEKWAERFRLNAEKIRRKSLERKVSGVAASVFFSLSIMYLSLKFTGNVIGNSSSMNFFGGTLFLLGLLASFFYLKANKKKVAVKRTDIKPRTRKNISKKKKL